MMRHNISGILNINKPGGMTSHDVVNQVRRIVGLKKVGHTGTLDPMATGVLLVCIGQATRLIEYLAGSQKVYRAAIRFGETTNTYDADGEITANANPFFLNEAQLQETLTQFEGNISQTPPPFSAIKKNGVPLYKLARKGIIVEASPRSVQITEIKLLHFDLPEAVIQVTCGPGTYIRSLAHDIGNILGVGAHLSALSRTANGNWRLEQAINLDELARLATDGNLSQALHNKEAAVSHLPQVTLTPEQLLRVSQGQTIDYDPPPDGPAIAAFTDNKQLAAILIYNDSGALKPKKVFIQPNELR